MGVGVRRWFFLTLLQWLEHTSLIRFPRHTRTPGALTLVPKRSPWSPRTPPALPCPGPMESGNQWLGRGHSYKQRKSCIKPYPDLCGLLENPDLFHLSFTFPFYYEFPKSRQARRAGPRGKREQDTFRLCIYFM